MLDRTLNLIYLNCSKRISKRIKDKKNQEKNGYTYDQIYPPDPKQI